MALGRNAQSVYQDLVESHGFAHRHNSVKRFLRALRAREPERFDVLEALPGEEAQMDYGQGALTRLANRTYRRPCLFVMTLKYSGKSFRKVAWKADQVSWARLHEEAFRTFGGAGRGSEPQVRDFRFWDRPISPIEPAWTGESAEPQATMFIRLCLRLQVFVL